MNSDKILSTFRQQIQLNCISDLCHIRDVKSIGLHSPFAQRAGDLGGVRCPPAHSLTGASIYPSKPMIEPSPFPLLRSPFLHFCSLLTKQIYALKADNVGQILHRATVTHTGIFFDFSPPPK